MLGHAVATKVFCPDTKMMRQMMKKGEMGLIPRWKRNLRVTDDSGKHLGSAYEEKTGKNPTPKRFM